MTVIINGTTGVTTPADSISGNLEFTGTGNRITGDFSNATFANRVMFQTSTVNGNTLVGFIPNGTGQNARVQTFASSDAANTSYLSIESNSVISQAAIYSGITGTGTYLPMTFYTGGSESLRLSKDYKTVILSGGSTSANGTGITFPATQSASTDANTLDDYEEGTFTPAFTGTSTNPTFTSYYGYGYYTKIGRQVTVWINIGWAARSGGTGDLNISVPFSMVETIAGGSFSINGLNMGASFFGSASKYASTQVGFLMSNISTGAGWQWSTVAQTYTGGFDLRMSLTFFTS